MLRAKHKTIWVKNKTKKPFVWNKQKIVRNLLLNWTLFQINAAILLIKIWNFLHKRNLLLRQHSVLSRIKSLSLIASCSTKELFCLKRSLGLKQIKKEEKFSMNFSINFTLRDKRLRIAPLSRKWNLVNLLPKNRLWSHHLRNQRKMTRTFLLKKPKRIHTLALWKKVPLHRNLPSKMTKTL